jgi:hypothetical protein
MATSLTRAVYRLLSEDKPVTPAGAAYLLRDEFTPIPVISETQESLDWLARNGLATMTGEGPFGPEYVKRVRDDLS